MNATALRDLRRATLPLLGVFLVRTASAGSSVSSLVDGQAPIKSSNEQAELFSGKWLFRPNAPNAEDRVRVVQEGGYDPTNGVLQPDMDWGGAPANGETYEIVGGVEPDEEFGSIVNAALRRCYTVAEVGLAATAGATRHGLNTAAPWLQAAQHVRQFGWLGPDDTRNAHDPYDQWVTWEAWDDEGTVYVEHGPTRFNNGETIYVRVLKPAYYSCRHAAGVFGSVEGLTLDTDEAPVALDYLLSAVMVEYWDRYVGQLPDSDPQVGQARQRRGEWALTFSQMPRKYLRTPPQKQRRQLLVGRNFYA